MGPPTDLGGAMPHALEELRKLQAVTDAALANLSVEDLLNELLVRVREIFSADTAAILLLDESTNELVARAAKGLEEEVEQGVRIPVGGGFAGKIAAERHPVYIAHVDHSNVLNPILREKGIESLLGVPLVVQGNVIGVLHVGSLTFREFSDSDTNLLQLVADRIALAVNVGLYERQRVLLQTMQQSLLPDSLPAVFGLEFAARYVPASGGDVGGDWYDVFPLRDGRLVLVVGDVVGTGIHAATVMGRLRNMLRAYVFYGTTLPAVIDQLNGIVRALDANEMATLALAVYDPRNYELTIINAGHPPPVLCLPTEEPQFVATRATSPIGVLREVAAEEEVVKLQPGATLLFYTDGLVERRGMSLTTQLEQLRTVVDATTSVEALLDRALRVLAPDESDDDIALLAVSVARKTTGPWTITVPALPASLGQLRTVLRKWLTDLDVPTDLSYDVVVAVGEACGNAVEHAYGPAVGEVELSLARSDRILEAMVRDGGRWRDPRGYDRGRGIKIMETLASSASISRTTAGTEVRLTWRLADGRDGA